MNIHANDFGTLRQTILKHQWKASYETISTMFAQNVPQFTVFVAGQMARSCLRFQSRFDLEWVVSFAQEMIGFIQEGRGAPNFPDEAKLTFADAPHGVTSLVSGVIDLWESVSVAHNVDEKAKQLVYALDRIIVAEISNYWETVYPEETHLREQFGNAETTVEGRRNLSPDTDKEKLYRGVGFLKQPESRAYRAARLLGIVDEIELILNQ